MNRERWALARDVAYLLVWAYVGLLIVAVFA